jgi:hypothetical protein
MNIIRTLVCCVVLIVGLTACAAAPSQQNPSSPTPTVTSTPTTQAAAPTPTAQAASPTATAQAVAPDAARTCPDNTRITADSGHLLVDIEAPERARAEGVQLVKPDHNVTIPVGVGSVLGHSDALQLADGAAATVLCDTTLQPVVISSPGDTLANACAPPTGTLTADGLSIDTPRGPGLNMPFIISPLAPNLATLPNVVRWNHTGAERYTLCFSQGLDESICIEENKEEDIRPDRVEPISSAVPELPARRVAVYEPVNMPELSPGTYILKITAVDTESPQEAERLITVLGEQSDTVITATQDAERARSNLQARGISADVQTLAAAHIYIAADMYNDALNLLEPLTQSQDTDVRLSASMLIARMYAQNDLAYEAIEAYHAALEIVQEQYPTHIRRLAAIRLGYGRVWLSFGHEYLVQARPHLSEARDLYMRLNATDRVCWIADKLDDADEE